MDTNPCSQFIHRLLIGRSDIILAIFYCTKNQQLYRHTKRPTISSYRQHNTTRHAGEDLPQMN